VSFRLPLYHVSWRRTVQGIVTLFLTTIAIGGRRPYQTPTGICPTVRLKIDVYLACNHLLIGHSRNQKQNIHASMTHARIIPSLKTGGVFLMEPGGM
jgi:hypothetical protein